MKWLLPRREFHFDRLLVMGIVNVTPDSFSDGGRWSTTDAAVDHALRLAADGADILDIGGESTRPGAIPVAEDEELRRVIPVIRALAKQADKPISIDTMKPGVAAASLAVGAEIINDVSGLRDPQMMSLMARSDAAAIVMHMQGTPATMQENPHYVDVVDAVDVYFGERIRNCGELGIAYERLALDPGIGFGKSSKHNWQLLAALPRLQTHRRPLCLGVSRKGFLGKDRTPSERMIAGLAVACHGMAHRAAHIVRTHDVRPTRDAIDALVKIIHE